MLPVNLLVSRIPNLFVERKTLWQPSLKTEPL